MVILRKERIWHIEKQSKEKGKAWSCKCTTSDVQINDLCLVCQPLFYDHQNTLHTAITWYAHSTSFSLHENKTNSSSCEEWGQINDTFYKWPLYKCCSSDEGDKDDDDLVGDFMQRYFDGDLMIKSNLLLAQLPHRVVDSVWEKIVPLTTIHVSLFPRQKINNNYHNRYRTFAHKGDVITIENATMFCCRGLHSTPLNVFIHKSNFDKFHLKNTQEQRLSYQRSIFR